MLYELAGFPGKAPGPDHGSGRRLLKNQDGEHALSTNLPPAASPGARVGLSSGKCARATPRVPALQEAPQRDGLLWFIWGITQLCWPMLLFLCYSLKLQPGARRGVQGLGGQCRCPAQCWTSLSSLPCSHPRHSGRGEMLLLGCAAAARALMAAPEANP